MTGSFRTQAGRRYWLKKNPSSKSTVFFLVLLTGFVLVITVRLLPSDWTIDHGAIDFNLKVIQQKESLPRPPFELSKDHKVNSDLFPSRLFDENSCISRYQSPLYRKKLPRKASPYLISKLRSYEARHKKCGPYTELYNRTLEGLNSVKYSSNSECKYLIWIGFLGLGNRIISLASAFLYAILTDRVLLVDRGVDIADLFCEPFPGTSWLLPLDFPLTNRFEGLNRNSNESYANMLKNSNFLGGSLANESTSPPYVYLHIVDDYDKSDKLLCDREQTSLQRVPWLLLKSDEYFIPFLFLIPKFQKELHNLFPNKETVFHHLGRYLFNPTNSVWGIITRYYHSYLLGADEIVGIQIRVFEGDGPFKHVSQQILACILEERILPKVNKTAHLINQSGKQKTIAVLLTSLELGYFYDIRKVYKGHQTVTGEVISVYQPSHEHHQHSEKRDHNGKAWAEMYLLSLTDKLVTSAWSTFGYVAQSLGDLKPWTLFKPENGIAPDPPCSRGVSIEPCFHNVPFYDCKERSPADVGALVPHVKHCEDMRWGIKLVDPNNEF